MGAITLRDSAQGALALMQSRGFDQAQVTAATMRQDELNIADNEPSLLRSTDSGRIILTGIGAATDREEPRELHQSMARGAVGELRGEAHRATHLVRNGAARDALVQLTRFLAFRCGADPGESDG